MASITKRGDSYRITVTELAGDTLGNIVCDLSLKRA